MREGEGEGEEGKNEQKIYEIVHIILIENLENTTRICILKARTSVYYRDSR